jgi:hypothetical protein
MIKKEWHWMFFNEEWNNNPKKDNKIGLKSYMCNMDDKNDDYQDHLEDGVDDFISTNKPTPYNDDDYDY